MQAALWLTLAHLALFLHVLAKAVGPAALGSAEAAGAFAWTIPAVAGAVYVAGVRMWGLST